MSLNGVDSNLWWSKPVTSGCCILSASQTLRIAVAFLWTKLLRCAAIKFSHPAFPSAFRASWISLFHWVWKVAGNTTVILPSTFHTRSHITLYFSHLLRLLHWYSTQFSIVLAHYQDTNIHMLSLKALILTIFLLWHTLHIDHHIWDTLHKLLSILPLLQVSVVCEVTVDSQTLHPQGLCNAQHDLNFCTYIKNCTSRHSRCSKRVKWMNCPILQVYDLILVTN